MKPQDRIGTNIGGCALQRLLGQGAYGAVYLAMQINLERPVAVKILTASGTADPRFLDRFIREARTVAAMDSTNIIRVFDMGKTDEDQAFIVMELVDGMSLDELLQSQGTIDEALAAEFMRQAAEGVAVAAELGIIHRDIKPANLMVTSKGVVKVADFGLAKAAEEANALTQSGAILGTPYYIAPELARGEDPTVSADIYSLGVTLYQLVIGEVPYKGPTAVGVLYQHVSKPVPRLCDTHAGKFSQGFSDIIERAMAKKPADRYASASEMAADLQEFLRSLPPDRAPRFELPARPEWVPPSSLAHESLKETLIDASGLGQDELDASRVDGSAVTLYEELTPPEEEKEKKKKQGYAPWGGAPAASPPQPDAGPADGAPAAEVHPGGPGEAIRQVALEQSLIPRHDRQKRGDNRIVMVCRVDRALAAGRPGATSVEIDMAFGHLLAVLQTIPGGVAKRILDRVVVVVDTPEQAIDLLMGVREKLKQMAPGRSLKDRWTMRGLLHAVPLQKNDIEVVPEDVKALLFDISDLARPGSISASASALELFSGSERQFFDVEPGRRMTGRAGAMVLHIVKRRKK